MLNALPQRQRLLRVRKKWPMDTEILTSTYQAKDNENETNNTCIHLQLPHNLYSRTRI